ncbi:MAG: GNAT family N-acetyltransferase [Paracoccaceae bacterium]
MSAIPETSPIIRPVAPEDVPGLNAVLDQVAREGRWLAMLKGPDVAATERFVHAQIEARMPHMVARIGADVVGWCDISPLGRESMAHMGGLGMGIVVEHRGRGIGGKLLGATLEAADRRGIERVELSVFPENTAALRLYRAHGFEEEGLRRAAWRVGDTVRDLLWMGRLAPALRALRCNRSAPGPFVERDPERRHRP